MADLVTVGKNFGTIVSPTKKASGISLARSKNDQGILKRRRVSKNSGVNVYFTKNP